MAGTATVCMAFPQCSAHALTVLLAHAVQLEQPPGQAPLAEGSVRALLRALQPMRGQIPGDVGQLLKKVQEQVTRRFPSLAPLVSVSALRGLGAGSA